MIRKLNYCLILLLLIFKISGCKRVSLPHSIGGRDEVILVAPDEFQVDSFINQLEKVEYYPTEENVFNVERVDLSEIDRYKLWRNVIIVGNFEESYINDLLGEEAKEELEKGAQLFLEKDLWVRLQTAVIITGMNTEETQSLLDRSTGTIYRVLREEETERFSKMVYMQGYQEKETKKMEALLGASFKIPLGYRLAKDEAGFMSYIRKNPDRMVTLLYSAESINNPLGFRDSLFSEYFNGDEVVVDSIAVASEDGGIYFIRLTSLDTMNFNDVKAIQVRGVWKNDKLKGGPMGGPFVSYVFQKDGIWYFLDGHVFAPGKKKWPFLEEVNIILNTFKKEN
ncbi:DUF4837 family protein [candidate division WOR-3 bacterium]|nr:DUF4837 family protein [candidate division WOR-3 bacterium]